MKGNKAFVLASLMIAGEGIFLLPFVVARIFRPTFLKVFEINNLELGTAFSLYGVIAMGSYFASGPIADRYSPRKLIVSSLLLTATGGIFMAMIPSLFSLTLLYGFWGLSTIFLYWAASVKAIRVFGGDNSQGKAFGAVDAGRGFVAAALGTIGVLLFDMFLPVSADTATLQDTTAALTRIILIFSVVVVASAILIHLALPETTNNATDKTQKISLAGVKNAIKRHSVWLNAIILLCAYVGYKCTDDFSLYASDVFGYNDVESAHIGTVSYWTRPIAALLAGFLGDRYQISKIVIACFVVLILGSLVISSGILVSGMVVFISLTIATTSAGIYGLRGLYFALFQESKLPLIYTGSAVGIISVVGYTPDIFMGPLMGIVLDNNPGALGHQYLFAILAAFGIMGLITTLIFKKTVEKS